VQPCRARAYTTGVVVAALVTATLAVAPSAGAAPSPPAKWDRRVTKYVRFVEHHRKLSFDHPVPVKFLASKAFVHAYLGDDTKVSKQDRADAERYAGQLRALGLIQGPVDLIQSERDLDAADVVGFYDQHEDTLFVRGQDLRDTDVRVTLVHELTHALQDQKFDLDALDRQAETSGESFAETALVEGDATSVENEYVASLPRGERDAYNASFDDETPPDAPSTGSVPPALELFESAPYVFGPPYLDTLKAEGGLAQVDRAFRDPPHSEEEIIDAVAANRRGRPKPVAVPKLAQGEKRDGAADDFGALSLYFVLASRLAPETALRAAEGWGGDRYLAFTRGADRQECVRVAFQGDTGADTDEIASALGEWAASLPSGAAAVRHVGATPTLTACDTAGTTAPDQPTLDTAVDTLANRNELVREFVDNQAPVADARCVADLLVVDPEVAPLFNKETLTDEEEKLVGDRITQGIDRCHT
jgi:hypothetical protein